MYSCIYIILCVDIHMILYVQGKPRTASCWKMFMLFGVLTYYYSVCISILSYANVFKDISLHIFEVILYDDIYIYI